MSDRRTVFGWIRRFASGPPVALEVQQRFEVYCDALMGRAAPWLLLFFLLVAVLWWPTDLLFYGDRPRELAAIAAVRGAIVLQHAFWLTLGRRALRRRPAVIGTFIAVSEAAIAGGFAGLAGGLDSPWPYYLFTFPLVSVGLARPLSQRLAGTAAIGGGSLGAFLMTSGTPLNHPHLPATVSFMAFAVCFCALVGHGAWLLLRENFVKQQLIDAQRARLDGFSRELERRVAAQTRDLQVLSRRLETLREEERSWMARELHDALGQELTAARYALDLARSRLSADDARLDRALLDVADRIHLAHGSMRRIVQRVRPRILDELGLIPALQWLGRETIEAAGLRARVAAEPPDTRLAPAIETALYRVAQEAVTNALRHAEARSITLALHVAPDRCRFTVADDGGGMARSRAGGAVDGIGCIGIRERVAALGGSARWVDADGGGTRVEIEIPLESSC